jgi:hypothetical protein
MSGGFTGGCLCGAVTYESTNDPMLAGHCHCTDCRRSSGTGHGTNIVVPEDGFTVTGEVTFYDRPADSGNIVSRGFCPNCGSALYSKNDGVPGVVFPRASSLDDPGVAKPAIVVYASRAVAWDPVDPALPAFDEMPEGDLAEFLAESA